MFNRDYRIPIQWKYVAAFLLLTATSLSGLAQTKPDCPELPDAAHFKSVVQGVVKQGSAKNGGMGNQEWAAIVNRDGVVCAIVFSGTTRGDQWPGSRVIAAEKASTANGLSGRDYALSTANIYRRVAARTKPLQPRHQRAAQSKRCLRRSSLIWHSERSDGRQSHRRRHRLRRRTPPLRS